MPKKPAVPAYRPCWLADPGLPAENVFDRRIGEIIHRVDAALDGVPLPTPQWRQRFHAGMAFLYPMLAASQRPLGTLSALEVGCGTGPKAAGLSQVFREYVGIDIDAGSIAKARAVTSRLGLSNLQLEVCEAARIDTLLGAGRRFDVIVLHAVVEHLTIAERLDLMRVLWEHLDDEGVLYVGELPNRLSPVDQHSSFLAYFNALPDELALRYADRSRREGYAARVRGGEDPLVSLYRTGRGASYHEFELSIAPCAELGPLIRLDAWDNTLLNLHPVQRHERELLAQFRYLKNRNTCHVLPVPPGFARYWLYFTLGRRPWRAPRWPEFAAATPAPDPALPVDVLANPLHALDGPLRLPVAQGARTLTLGLRRDGEGNGRLRVVRDEGTILWEGALAELAAALGEHWNPHVYLTLGVRGAGEILVEAAGEPAPALVHAFFR